MQYTAKSHYPWILYLQICLLTKMYLEPENQYPQHFLGPLKTGAGMWGVAKIWIIQMMHLFSAEAEQGDALPHFCSHTETKQDPAGLSQVQAPLYPCFLFVDKAFVY